MSQLNINITLDGLDASLNAHQLASTIESIIKQHGLDNVITSIYDNDSSTSSNPIFAQNIMKKVR